MGIRTDNEKRRGSGMKLWISYGKVRIDGE